MTRAAPRLAVAIAAAAVGATALGLVIDRGAAALAALDPGPWVRWGLPMVTTIGQLAMSLTVGLLGLAVFVVPERASTHRRESLARWAFLAAAVWASVTAAQVLLAFADISGTGIFQRGYWAQLAAFAWPLEYTRVLIISALLAAVAAVLARWAHHRATMAWALVAALFGVVVLALNGHAAGSASHEDAVNALAVHLVAMACWVGGLAGLALVWSSLAKDREVSFARYSTVALWSFVAIGLSGIQQSAIRLGSLSALATPYGLLIVAKVVAFAALGWMGWRQRARFREQVQQERTGRWGFLRLAGVELIVMAVAVGIAVALSRGAPPVPDAPAVADRFVALTGYPDPGPMTSADWLTAWRIEWLFFSIAVVAMGLYAAGVVTLRRRGDAWPVGRTASWMVGWLIWIYATCGPLDIWGRVLFSTHMIMHMLVAMVVPIFLVLGAPITLLLRAVPPRPDKTWGPREFVLQIIHSRAMRVLANPIVAAVLFFGSLAVFYYSPLFNLALVTHTGHLLMMSHFLLTGYLFAWVLIGVDPGPARWSPLVLLTILFITVSFHAFFGVLITGDPQLLGGGFFTQLQSWWMPDPAADQVLAGEIAWGVGEAPTLVLAVIVAAQWFRRDEVEQRRADRQADRDNDAALADYNRMLAQQRERFRDPSEGAP